jgi:S-(hydroxymethyl)glutathione dehydrogenase / alcohol dehydrogenase
LHRLTGILSCSSTCCFLLFKVKKSQDVKKNIVKNNIKEEGIVMKAAICYEIGKPLVVEDGVTVDSPGKEEVKVKIAVTAICGSDLGFLKEPGFYKLPIIVGHEIAGTIDEVGEGVTEFKKGDHVIIGTVTAGCGHCYYCTVGMPFFCTNRPRPSQGRHVNKKGQRLSGSAGFAEYTTVNQCMVAKIPDDMPLEQASLLACGVTAGFGAVVNRAQVKPYSSVVVMGVGGVGMNSIQGAVFCGAYPIIAADVVDSKLEAARKFGATHTINLAKVKDTAKAVRDLTGGRGADYVFVTVGNINALNQGFAMSGPRGMTVIVGIIRDNLSSLKGFDFLNERMLTGAGGGSIRLRIDIPMMCDLYKSGRLKLDELITHRYPLEKVNEAIADLEKGDAIRNIIVF